MNTKPIIVWFREDLRIHDHPALAMAINDSSLVIPVYIFDTNESSGEYTSANRTRFLFECLIDLKAALGQIGGDLVVRSGDPIDELKQLAKDTGANAVYYTADYSPYALGRDKRAEESLEKSGIETRSFGGKLAVGSLQKLRTRTGSAYKVFTPFWRAWSQVERRPLAATPDKIFMPDVNIGELPDISSFTSNTNLSHGVLPGGEKEGRRRLKQFLNGPIDDYGSANNDLGVSGTSRLSPYLHFGCISIREIETMLPSGQGADAWHRQLAWREFYYYVLLHFPHPERAFQEKYRRLEWIESAELLEAWKQGMTGYPVVDAGMRQLRSEGWMHNRARLIVGSFLTKDLGINWRDGEAHFMEWLVDGDMANNNGNWQWIASVGVDLAPLFRRLYNPSSQQYNYDPQGIYVRTHVPELKTVPDKYLGKPWEMSDSQQREYGCIIGVDYPAPVVDHKEARELTLERYRDASGVAIS